MIPGLPCRLRKLRAAGDNHSEKRIIVPVLSPDDGRDEPRGGVCFPPRDLSFLEEWG